MIWNQKIETMKKEEMRSLQLERLQDLVNYVYENVEFYRKKFDTAGVKPSDIKSLEDIAKLPLQRRMR